MRLTIVTKKISGLTETIYLTVLYINGLLHQKNKKEFSVGFFLHIIMNTY